MGNHSTKRLKGKGDKKKRDCLGPGCNAKFQTTPETRLCPTCKRNNSSVDDVGVFAVCFENGKSKEFG